VNALGDEHIARGVDVVFEVADDFAERLVCGRVRRGKSAAAERVVTPVVDECESVDRVARGQLFETLLFQAVLVGAFGSRNLLWELLSEQVGVLHEIEVLLELAEVIVRECHLLYPALEPVAQQFAQRLAAAHSANQPQTLPDAFGRQIEHERVLALVGVVCVGPGLEDGRCRRVLLGGRVDVLGVVTSLKIGSEVLDETVTAHVQPRFGLGAVVEVSRVELRLVESAGTLDCV